MFMSPPLCLFLGDKSSLFPLSISGQLFGPDDCAACPHESWVGQDGRELFAVDNKKDPAFPLAGVTVRTVHHRNSQAFVARK